MILVTGATGNAGGAVVRALGAEGEQVRALVRDPDRARLPHGVEAVAGDLNRPDTLARSRPALLVLVYRASNGDGLGTGRVDDRHRAVCGMIRGMEAISAAAGRAA